MTRSRRQFIKSVAAIAAGSAFVSRSAVARDPFQFQYMLPSCMYGYTSLETILPEVKKIGATAIDVWPKVHGNQREQLAEMGEEKFAALLKQNDVKLGCLTQYKLGPFGLQDEMRLAQRFGCSLIVTGGSGPAGLTGTELKQAVATFAEKMKPHLAIAEETGVTIAIENHGKNLIDSPDAMKWLMEKSASKHLAIALAPYHLPQDAAAIAALIRELGPNLALFYAWQHGNGSMQKLPKEEELLQMPGRGQLDFQPIVDSLKQIRYAGWTEVFMHPVPRGDAILETTAAVTDEINRARKYLEQLR